MHTRSACLHCGLMIALLNVGAIGTAAVSAQETLYMYGPLGPAPAFKEAAVVFGDQHNVRIKVTEGPVSQWLHRAKEDADLVYSSAEFMMSAFIRAEELQIKRSSVTPLYLRPSAILVRPGNPKRIVDFPDLLRPGVKVMVVSGSGQTGMWEDMAGKLGNIETLRALRRNIVLFADDSGEAKRAWRENENIDAWLTWSIWYMPVRDHAQHIEVSRDYRVYRQCSIALTERGKTKPLARQFVEFLMSPEAASIFGTWGWMTPPRDVSPVKVLNDIYAVCRVKNDEWQDGVGGGLACVKRLVEDYKSMGVPTNEVHISAVFHGDAAYWLLKDAAYGAYKKGESVNPNKAIIQELVQRGVSIELCAQTMEEHGWTQDDVLPEVKIVIGAYPRIIDLELQGYAYIRFF